MNNTLKRAITGGIFIATLIFCTIWSKYAVAGIFLFFTIVGTFEYYSIIKKVNFPNLILGYSLSALTYLLVVGSSIFNFPIGFAAILLIFVSLIFIRELFKFHENGFENILHTILPSLYIALPFSFLILGNQYLNTTAHYSPSFILAFFFTLWSNDTGAFLAGKAFGKNKLSPKISPNKTWEGTIGGAILALVIAFICSFFYKEMTAIEWMIMALIIVVFGSFGDLVESMLKRNYNVKDSGKILPGHGGILDRFDGLLIASPVVFAFLILKDLIYTYFQF